MSVNINNPRVKRTRYLIINAFISLVTKKGFDSITVKDITTAATINRATFYAHFTDKYALLDTVIVEKFSEIFSNKLQSEMRLNENTIRILILCVCEYFEMVKSICKCGFDSILPLIGDKIVCELYSTIYALLIKEHELAETEKIRAQLVATMMSTSMYNVIYKWEVQKRPIPQELLISEIIGFVFTGMDTLKR
ncbi:TetR/AcrR family transcriptional regulator [Clostridium beijerinckii]|uniref:HTH tetR-type domain-containing protein n=1 Tax=Clostridium beijerinckii TaxID=1520 RepID=A0A1S9N0Q1_CLOBE|nr:TetR/AcrR family transcriptional regulator [Clostridium beijerinckii]MZK53112.1 TetR family transcriptional regulator [Clostridium beijerinckii]MZK61250.1 TetR family transcriptional regulator [Clostridium beijerinckii]MZK71449.1 TetR family transcriptional regulator [Clostridium beijerinckii]MZK76779.1 TetR family transcriptional regulator [Clostridium beijerinckii]MZK86516.1 TetR family transcriptional regulator [Clostridium beijerinckii]